MTRSNFDPDNPDRDPGTRGGLDRFLGPEARRTSKMPADMIDGKTEPDAPADNDESHEAQAPDAAARALEKMTEEHPGEPGMTSQGGI